MQRASRSEGVSSQRGLTEMDKVAMKRALELAAKSAALDEVPVGAVVYQGERIVAEAHNVREANCDPTGHAELKAIRLAAERLGSWRLSDCTLVVTLEPCAMCAGAIVQARVGRLVYGAVDPKAGAVESLYRICNDKRLNHDVDVISGVMAGQASQLLKAFFKNKREIQKVGKQSAPETSKGHTTRKTSTLSSTTNSPRRRAAS